MKRLLVRLLLLLPLGGLLVGVNYAVDPANLFSGGAYERGIAAQLARGLHVTDLHNYDERLLQKSLLAALPRRPRVLVLGSSRAMIIGADVFPGGGLYNGAVSGGVLEDMLAVYALYTARGWYPDTLVLGLDPWMFNANHGQVRWKTLAPEALGMRRALGAEAAGAEEGLGELFPTGSVLAKLGELVSLSYFQESIKYLRDPAHHSREYRAVTTALNDGFTKHPDNSITYDRAFREQNTAAAAQDYIARKPVYSLGTFTALSADTRTTLTRLVADARQHGAVVQVFLAPYHPTVWQFLQAQPEYQYAARAEMWCREFAAAQGLALAGSFDPAPLGLTGADFYDAMHCKPHVVEQLLRPLAARGKMPVPAL